MYCKGTADILDAHGCVVDTHVFIYTHTLRVLPIHFGRETVPSVSYTVNIASKHEMLTQCWCNVWLASQTLAQYWTTIRTFSTFNISQHSHLWRTKFNDLGSGYNLQYIALVEMAISTNRKPTIFCNLYENTGRELPIMSWDKNLFIFHNNYNSVVPEYIWRRLYVRRHIENYF